MKTCVVVTGTSVGTSPGVSRSPVETGRTLSVGVVDNDVLTLGLLADGLREQFGVNAVSWALTDGREAVERCERADQCPQVLVLDMSLEGMSGVEVCRRIRQASPRPAIVGLTSFSPAQYRGHLVDAGAQALVVKAEIAQLGKAVWAVRDGAAWPARGPFQSAAQAYERLHVNARTDAPRLTAQESRVMDLVAFGLTNAEIAKELGVGVATVKTHVHHAMGKLGVANRTSAMSVWLMMREQEEM